MIDFTMNSPNKILVGIGFVFVINYMENIMLYRLLKNCTVLFSVVFVGGCIMAQDLSHRYDAAEFNAQQKSIITISMYRGKDGKQSFGGSIRIVKLDANHMDSEKRKSYMFNVSGDYNVSTAMIEPGAYYIDYVSWAKRSSKFDSGISSNNEISYGAFEVKPGMVAHIGKLEIIDYYYLLFVEDSNKFNELPYRFELKQHYDLQKAKNDFLKNNKPKLSAKMQNVKLYGAGTIVSKSSGGKWIFKKGKSSYVDYMRKISDKLYQEYLAQSKLKN